MDFLRRGIDAAITAGVPQNTIVLLLLFPLIVTLIAAARHLFGLRGFGIFTPAVIAVAFLSTGLTLGLGLFAGTLLIAAAARWLTKGLRLQYLPRLSLLILFICIGILVAFLAVPKVDRLSVFGFRLSVTSPPVVGLPVSKTDQLKTDEPAVPAGRQETENGKLKTDILNVGIFPLLLLILLTETFISAEISHGTKFAARVTVETLFLAVTSYLIMNLGAVRSWVLINPEATVLSLLAANILLGRFTGLRLLEYWRFRELLRK